MKRNRQEKKQLQVLYIFADKMRHQLHSTTQYGISHALAKLGWHVSLASMDAEKTLPPNGLEELCFPVPDIYLVRNLLFHLKVAGYLLDHWQQIDVVLFGQTSGPIFFLLKLWRLIRGDLFPLFILDTRTVPMEDLQSATLKDRFRGSMHNLMAFIGNKWADGQTVITKRMAELVKIPENQLLGIWPSGADLGIFTRSQALRQFPAEDEPIQLAYIGVLHHERNLMALCKATEMANQEGLRFELTLTGEGTEEEDLKQYAESTNGRIRVQAPVTHDQVPEVLAKAHVGVLPFPDEMKYRVSSPIKLFEYLASGLPIMATRIVCHTDVLQDEPVVFWAEGPGPEEMLATLRQIEQDRQLLPQIGRASARLSEKFSWEASGEKLSAALHAGIDRQWLKLQAKPAVDSGSEKIR